MRKMLDDMRQELRDMRKEIAGLNPKKTSPAFKPAPEKNEGAVPWLLVVGGAVLAAAVVAGVVLSMGGC